MTLEEQNSVAQLLDGAFNAYVDRDYEKAIENFKKILKIDPKNKVAMTGIKRCKNSTKKKKKIQIKQGQNDLESVKKLIKREKWLDAIDNLYGMLSKTSNQVEVLELKNKLVALIKKKMVLSPINSSDHLMYQGILAYIGKHYDEAVRVWKETLIKDPENIKLEIFIERGETLLNEILRHEILTVGRVKAKSAFDSENYQEAIDLWKKILDFEPANQEAQRELARTQEIVDKKNKEILIGTHYDKGVSLFQEGNFAESLKEWQDLLTFDPDNEVAKDYVKRISELQNPKPEVQNPKSKIQGQKSNVKSKEP